jgi:hypothetical protein
MEMLNASQPCRAILQLAPSEEELLAFESELSYKCELFFKFVMIMWEMAI